jgi:hypothetical protein
VAVDDSNAWKEGLSLDIIASKLKWIDSDWRVQWIKNIEFSWEVWHFKKWMEDSKPNEVRSIRLWGIYLSFSKVHLCNWRSVIHESLLRLTRLLKSLCSREICYCFKSMAISWSHWQRENNYRCIAFNLKFSLQLNL